MNKQSKIIAAMVATTIVLCAGVLLNDRSAIPTGDAHHEQAGHDDRGEQNRAAQHQPAATNGAHKDERQAAGLIAFTDEQVATAAISVKTAGAVHMDTFIRMPGEVKFNEDRTAHVTPRVDGIVQAVQANLGATVKKGEELAVIASAAISDQRSQLAAAQKRVAYARGVYLTEKELWESRISARQDFAKAEQELQEAEIEVRNAQQKLQALGATGTSAGPFNKLVLRAPFDGLIVDKHIALGESVGAETRVFTVSDLSTVWAEVVVPAKDLEIVRVGTQAILRSTASEAVATGKVSFVSALIGEQTRSARARVVLKNPQLAWRPGLFVNVDIVTGAAEVGVAVEREALQHVDGRQIVYRKVDGGFIAQPVTVGRSDGRMVEVLNGLQAGQQYAAANSFTIKAEQGKGAAGHDD
jgi:cobalt-zinc-cadmium efflux system membrane fusion protein